MSFIDRYFQQTAGGMRFLGYWNAATNTPTLQSGTGEAGYWVVSAAGQTLLDGESDWQPKDWAVFSSGAYRKIDNSDKVDSLIGIDTDNFSCTYNADFTLATVTFYSSAALTLASRIALVSFEYNAAKQPTKETWSYYASNGSTVIDSAIYQNTWAGNALTSRVKL